jgi:hypothetical protein
VKCRDALMALGREHAASEWAAHVNNPPRTADFKGWANIFADRLSQRATSVVLQSNCRQDLRFDRLATASQQRRLGRRRHRDRGNGSGDRHTEDVDVH